LEISAGKEDPVELDSSVRLQGSEDGVGRWKRKHK